MPHVSALRHHGIDSIGWIMDGYWWGKITLSAPQQLDPDYGGENVDSSWRSIVVSKIVRLQVFPPMALIGDGTKELRVNIDELPRLSRCC
jgi:hypothetical protein